MRERPNRHAWKACEAQVSVGSNPTPSAMKSDFEAAMREALNQARIASEEGDVPVTPFTQGPTMFRAPDWKKA